MMEPFILDTTGFPIVVTKLPGEIDDASLADYFHRFEKLVLLRRERFISIVDARPLKGLPNSRIRERIAQWQKEHPEGETLNQGIAIITSSVLVRGFMAAVGLIYRPVVRTEYVATLEAALEFGEKQLRRR
jgi:hypothetical protein